MAAKSTAAVFAGANHRGAGAEVVTVVQTAAGDGEVVLAVAEVACPEPFHRLSGGWREEFDEVDVCSGGICSCEGGRCGGIHRGKW
jgi:hypothetical protein